EAHDAARGVDDLGDESAQAGRQVDKLGDEAKEADKKLDGMSDGLADSLKGLAGLAAVGAGLAWVGNVTIQADQMAARFGVAADEMATLRHAATSTHVEMDEFQDLFVTMGERFGDAVIDPTSEIGKTFQRIGVEIPKSLDEIPSSMEQLRIMADALQGIENPAQRASVASRLFGDVGVRLLPFLEQGSEGIEEMAEHVDALGGGLEGGTTQAVKDFWAGLADLQTLAVNLADEVIGSLSDAFSSLGIDMDDVTEYLGYLIEDTHLIESALSVLGVTALIVGGKMAVAWVMASGPLNLL